jgi:hypothetical protein
MLPHGRTASIAQPASYDEQLILSHHGNMYIRKHAQPQMRALQTPRPGSAVNPGLLRQMLHNK